MTIIKKMIQVLSITGSLVLYGCSSSEDPPADDNTTLSGVFSTPVVKGLKYSTSTQNGTTDATGSFKYKDGEVISFYIGDIYVGQANAKSILTPLDLSQTAPAIKSLNSTKASNINDNWAINLFNLLLALDANGNTDDGIEITTETTNQAQSITLQLNLPPTEFIADTTTLEFTITVNVTLSPPTEVTTFINTNFSNNSDWGTMVWGTSSWNNQ